MAPAASCCSLVVNLVLSPHPQKLVALFACALRLRSSPALIEMAPAASCCSLVAKMLASVNLALRLRSSAATNGSLCLRSLLLLFASAASCCSSHPRPLAAPWLRILCSRRTCRCNGRMVYNIFDISDELICLRCSSLALFACALRLRSSLALFACALRVRSSLALFACALRLPRMVAFASAASCCSSPPQPLAALWF